MMKILETERLIIEEARLSDSSFFMKLLNSPNWIEFIGDRNIKSTSDAENYIKESLIKSYNKNGYGLYKVSLKQNKQPIGICGFVKRDYLESADIGFATLPEFEGSGYTYESCIALLEYGKNKLSLNPILAITSHDNIKSIGLLKKIGLSRISSIQPDPNQEELLLFSN